MISLANLSTLQVGSSHVLIKHLHEVGSHRWRLINYYNEL